MDSKRTLRSTVVTLAALTAALGGMEIAAKADTDRHIDSYTDGQAEGQTRSPAESQAQSQAESRAGNQAQRVARAPVTHVRTWRTSAEPRVTARRPRSSSKRFALDQVVRRSWGLREFRCLDNLWTRESGWNHRAVNRSSGAYGIPQALPAGKMSGAGKDWRHNPETQIRWGLSYIKGRYGRPCGAWGHFKRNNWY